MKKFTALLSVLVMLCLCVLSVSAAEDYVMYDLTDLETAQTVIGQIGAGKDSAFLTKGGILATAKLVEFRLHEILPEGTVYEYPIMMVEYYGSTAATNIRADWRFGGNGNNYVLSDNVISTEEGVILDFVANYEKAVTETYADSYAHLVTFYPILGEADSVTIHKIAFFKNVEAYEAYRTANPLGAAPEDDEIIDITEDEGTTDEATTDEATTDAGTTTTAPVTADPFTAVAVVMAVSAGAALVIKKRR